MACSDFVGLVHKLAAFWLIAARLLLSMYYKNTAAAYLKSALSCSIPARPAYAK